METTLRDLSVAHRVLIRAYLVAIVASLIALPYGWNNPYSWLAGLYVAYATHLSAQALHLGNTWLHAIGGLIPVVNVLEVSDVHRRLLKEIRKKGAKVGLMGGAKLP